MNRKHRFQWYQDIYEKFPAILADAEKAGEELMLDDLKGRFGLYAGASSLPGRLPGYVLDAIIEANRVELYPLRTVEDELRALVKDVFGDDYDVAVANTCEAGLRVACEVLYAPPTMRRGDAYRSRVIAPYGEDMEWGAAYGRGFPPRYKNLAVDRSASAGELGMEGKSLADLDTVFVKYAGASYPVHGIRQNVTPLLTRIDVEGTIERVREAARRHGAHLTGFQCIGYDTPGYGHGEHDGNGVPVFLRRLGEVAAAHDVPFLVDAASCLPIVGVSPVDIGADVMVWSMDKAGRSPIAGLMIGREEPMVPIRKALGLGGQRWGEVSSHSKGSFSLADPGRDSLVGLLAFLKVLRDDPERITVPVDRYHEIVVEAFADLKPARFREKLIPTKSHHMGGSELNYSHTWDDGGFGIPIFTIEDLYANTNPIARATAAMGIEPATIYSGNMFLGPGLGLLSEDGSLNEDYARLAAKTLVRSVEIVCTHAGLGD